MGVEIQNTTKINNNWQEKYKELMKFKRLLRSQQGATILLRKVQILTDLLQSYSPFTLDVKSKVTAANTTKIRQNTQNTQ